MVEDLVTGILNVFLATALAQVVRVRIVQRIAFSKVKLVVEDPVTVIPNVFLAIALVQGVLVGVPKSVADKAIIIIDKPCIVTSTS